MPTKKGKRSRSQHGGWFYKQSDLIFGKANKWIARQAGYIDDGLKKTKILSTLATPLAGMAASAASLNPLVGAVAGAAASAGIKKLGYGRRPHGKPMQHGSGTPFMNPNAASFGTIKF